MTDDFQRLFAHAESRKKMTKTQLLEDATAGDSAYIDARMEADMAEAYHKTLEAHLRYSHDCQHDFEAVANEPIEDED